jgi:hypothetical protein
LEHQRKDVDHLGFSEFEFSLLARQCLDRRIGDRDTLITEVVAWEAARNEQRATISWQFTIGDARARLRRIYPSSTQLGG